MSALKKKATVRKKKTAGAKSSSVLKRSVTNKSSAPVTETKRLSKTRTSQHVFPASGGKWVIKSGTGATVLGSFKSKQDAIDAAKKAVTSKRNMVIHGKSGQIIQRVPARSTVTDESIRKAVRSLRSRNGAKVTR